MMDVYMEYGAIGIIVSLFVMMVMNLIKNQKAQGDDLDSVQQEIVSLRGTMDNIEGMVIKLIDRWNKSDETSQRHREDIIKELNEVTDDLAYLKGRINGRNL